MTRRRYAVDHAMEIMPLYLYQVRADGVSRLSSIVCYPTWYE